MHTKLNYLTSPLQYEEKSKKKIFQICITAIIKRSLYFYDLIEYFSGNTSGMLLLTTIKIFNYLFFEREIYLFSSVIIIKIVVNRIYIH